MAEIAGNGPRELKELAAKLAVADPKLRTSLRKKLREIARPVNEAVRNEILTGTGWHAAPAGPTRTHGKPGRTYHHVPGSLRKEIADTVRTSVGASRVGVRMDIVSTGRRMPPGKQTLPVHTDRRRGWGHPVFLHGTVAARPRQQWAWVREWGPAGWFEEGGTRAGRAAQAAAKDALDEVRDFLS